MGFLIDKGYALVYFCSLLSKKTTTTKKVDLVTYFTIKNEWKFAQKKEEIVAWILWRKVECGLVVRAQGAGLGVGLDFNKYSLWL